MNDGQVIGSLVTNLGEHRILEVVITGFFDNNNSNNDAKSVIINIVRLKYQPMLVLGNGFK